TLASVKREIESLDPDRLLGTPTADLVAYLAGKYRYEAPALDRAGIELDQREAMILLTDRFRYSLPDGPVEVKGTQYTLTI
ncbi:hypothetical protein ACKI18_48470, partial [Streptomyces niveiscabiei]